MTVQEKHFVLPEISSFITVWDEEIGPKLTEFYPDTQIGDIDKLSIHIFQVYQFFWDNPDSEYKRTSIILPIKKLGKKAKILFDVIPNVEVRGGLQPFIIVFLFPDYFADEDLKIFDETLLKISQDLVQNRFTSLKEYYQEINKKIISKQEEKEINIDISDHYSYTAAMEDFQGGIKLFQSRNYEQAYQTLKKVLIKFEQEDHAHLIMEVVYIMGSLFAQQKRFKAAHSYFERVESLSKSLNHEKYYQTSLFMRGFCLFKNNLFFDSLKQFEKLEEEIIDKITYVNKLQFYSIYGKLLSNLQRYETALQKLLNALILSTEIEQSHTLKIQQSQILYELGIINYRIAFNVIKDMGVQKKEEYQMYLKESINFFERSIEILIELNESEILIQVYQFISNIYSLLGDEEKCLANLESAFIESIKSEKTGKKVNILLKIVQKQAKLNLHKENINKIKELLNFLKESKFVDLYTISMLHHELANSLIQIGDNNQGLKEFLEAYEILKSFKQPSYEIIILLNKIVKVYGDLNDIKNIEFFGAEIKNVEEKLNRIQRKEEKKIYPMADVKEVWIFHLTAGITIFTYAPETDIDHDLLGGFLTAIQQFSLEVSQKRIDSLIVGDDRYTIYQEDGNDFYMLSRSSIKNSEETVLKILKIVYNRFRKEFGKAIQNFQGNVSEFKPFDKMIESLDLTLII